AVLAELLADRVEQAPRKHRRAQSVNAVGVDVVEAVEMLEPELGTQSMFQSLTRHPPLLARNRVEVRLLARFDRPGKGDVERLGGQVRLLAAPVSELDVVGFAPPGQLPGRSHQGLAGCRAGGAAPAVDAVGYRHQPASAEQPADLE